MLANKAIVYFGKNIFAARRGELNKQRMWYYKMKETLFELKEVETEYQGMILENLSELSKFFIQKYQNLLTL